MDYREVEERDGLIKINPILTFTETEVWKYMAYQGDRTSPLVQEGLPVHRLCALLKSGGRA